MYENVLQSVLRTAPKLKPEQMWCSSRERSSYRINASPLD